jgi:hypothetical protein
MGGAHSPYPGLPHPWSGPPLFPKLQLRPNPSHHIFGQYRADETPLSVKKS